MNLRFKTMAQMQLWVHIAWSHKMRFHQLPASLESEHCVAILSQKCSYMKTAQLEIQFKKKGKTNIIYWNFSILMQYHILTNWFPKSKTVWEGDIFTVHLQKGFYEPENVALGRIHINIHTETRQFKKGEAQGATSESLTKQTPLKWEKTGCKISIGHQIIVSQQ